MLHSRPAALALLEAGKRPGDGEPPAMLTPEDLATRTHRVAEGAARVGRDLGLEVGEPRVLHEAFSVVVHLEPSPVVARVPVVLPHGLEPAALQERQARELAAVSWLARAGVPVTRPWHPEPVEGMTLWELVDVDREAPVDYLADAPLAAELHAAMRSYPGSLPFLGPLWITIPPCLEWLAAHPGFLPAEDLARARAQWVTMAPLLSSREAFEAAFPGADVHPVHGDAPSYNALRTPRGSVFADFEDVTLGPPEWDLALFGPEAAAAYDAKALRLGLRTLDAEVLRLMDAARRLQVVACLALVPQMPVLAEGLAPVLEDWRRLGRQA